MSSKIHRASELGTLAVQQARQLVPLRVATTTGAEFNSFGLDIDPVACVRLADVMFEFDSSFVGPQVRELLIGLPELRESRRNPISGKLPLFSVFGHADPAGDDEYNKKLSGRRAKAIFGLLTRDVAIWEALHNVPHSGDNWQTKNASARMREVLGATAPKAQRDLFKAYMTAVCPFQLDKSDFLGGGAPGGKAAFQGCGEFNPVLLLGKDELKSMSKSERDEAHKPNRRVVIYMFPPIPLNPKLWPCPTVDEPASACRSRFFPDADQRRASGASRREFVDAPDTFACRFYDRVAHKSPCEKPGHRLTTFLHLRILDERGEPRPDLEYRLTVDGVAIGDGKKLKTRPDGTLEHEILASAAKAVLEFEKTRIDLTLHDELESVDTVTGLQTRLNNLGYDLKVDGKIGEKTHDALMAFQRRSRLQVTGTRNKES